MNRELLEKPFDPEQIRRRQGRNGMLDYVEGHSVIQRLNDALESAWSFEITHHELRDDEVIVLGRLTAETISKMAFGTSQVTRERESRQLVSLGDDLKSAATDALKKCATFLGVGLHLYADKPLNAGRAATRPRRQRPSAGHGAAGRGDHSGGPWPGQRTLAVAGHGAPARHDPEDRSRPGARAG